MPIREKLYLAHNVHSLKSTSSQSYPKFASQICQI